MNKFIRRENLVARDGANLTMPSKVNWGTSIDFRKAIHGSIVEFEFNDITIDFRNVERAYPNGIVPIIAELDRWRAQGVKFDVLLPEANEIYELFRRNNWYYFLSNENGSYENHKLALHRFRDDNELNNLVNEVVEVCLQSLVFAEGVPQAFEWALNEVAGNVLVHSGIGRGWIQVLTYRENHRLVVIVADSGVGIPETMRSAYEFNSDADALELAIRKGITSRPDFGQGNGLAGAIAIAHNNQGKFAITSGRGRLQVHSSHVEPKNHFPPYQGTCVEIELDTNIPIDLPKALWGHKPIDYVETKFETDAGDLEVDLRQYASSFGNRITGVKIRTLLTNLLKQNPGKKLIIKMKEIGIISSSFADELFGKLFVELGPIDYSRVIYLSGLNSTCKSIIDQAINQRVVQESIRKNPPPKETI